jgi:hypothetical protein
VDNPTPYSPRKSQDDPTAQAKPQRKVRTRRLYSEEFKHEAAQLLLHRHWVPSVGRARGLTGPNVLYSSEKAIMHRAGPAGCILGDRSPSLKTNCGAWSGKVTS